MTTSTSWNTGCAPVRDVGPLWLSAGCWAAPMASGVPGFGPPGIYQSYSVGTRGRGGVIRAGRHGSTTSLKSSSPTSRPSSGGATTDWQRSSRSSWNWASDPDGRARPCTATTQLPLTSSWTTIVRTRGAPRKQPTTHGRLAEVPVVSDPTQSGPAPQAPPIDDIQGDRV